jgi:molybdopterin synthase sulfur carrier subunit
MTVRVKFFAYFRELFGGKDLALPLPPGATVAAALDLLCDTAARRAELFDGARLKPHIVLMINGAGLVPAAGLAASLADGDVLSVFPMMGGG